MKTNILLLFVLLFSATAMTLEIYCADRLGYRIMSFTQPGETEYSVGLVNKKKSGPEDADYVWSKMYGKNISSCSIFEEGFAIGAISPVLKVSKMEAVEVENIEFLKQAFACFCKIDRDLLNNCGISYPTYSNAVVTYSYRERCSNGVVVPDNNSPVLPFP